MSIATVIAIVILPRRHPGAALVGPAAGACGGALPGQAGSLVIVIVILIVMIIIIMMII